MCKEPKSHAKIRDLMPRAEISCAKSRDLMPRAEILCREGEIRTGTGEQVETFSPVQNTTGVKEGILFRLSEGRKKEGGQRCLASSRNSQSEKAAPPARARCVPTLPHMARARVRLQSHLGESREGPTREREGERRGKRVRVNK